MKSRVAVPALAQRVAPTGASPLGDLLRLTARPEVISFAGGLPAPETFDHDGIRAAFDHVLARSSRTALQYSAPEGDPRLRAVVAERVGARGVPTGPEDLVITTGSQQALTLVATALLEPGDVVLVENPTYLAALQCFGLAGARVVPVPTDEQGFIPAALDEIVARERPKLLYTVPNFQNPTGRSLSDERRRAVAETAGRSGMWIVEDDPYSDLHFDGVSRMPIAGLEAAADRTVLLGSFSKIMAPGLRLGWLRAPAAMRAACVSAKEAADLHSSTIDQAAAAHYLAGADLAGHLVRVRACYRERRDALLDGLPSALPEGSTWSRPEGGMFVWVRLPDGYDAAQVLLRALTYDVAYVPGFAFFAGPPDVATLRMSFTRHTPEETEEGLRRLSKAFG